MNYGGYTKVRSRKQVIMPTILFINLLDAIGTRDHAISTPGHIRLARPRLGIVYVVGELANGPSFKDLEMFDYSVLY